MLNQIINWFTQHETTLVWVGTLSAVTFLFSLLILPWVICRIPADYFKQRHEVTDTWVMLLRPRNIVLNIIGLLVLLAGIIMLITPGQGLLTILLGLAIMQFPGKNALIHRVVSRKGVLEAMNWIRRKYGVPELVL